MRFIVGVFSSLILAVGSLLPIIAMAQSPEDLNDSPLREIAKDPSTSVHLSLQTTPSTRLIEISFERTDSLLSPSLTAQDHTLTVNYKGTIQDGSSSDFATLTVAIDSSNQTSSAMTLEGYLRLSNVLYHLNHSAAGAIVATPISANELPALTGTLQTVSHSTQRDNATAPVEGFDTPPNSFLSNPLKLMKLATEADVEYTTAYGSAAAANTHIQAVINAVDSIYRRDLNIGILITHQRAWTSRTHPYPYTSGTNFDSILGDLSIAETSIPATNGFDNIHLFTGRNIINAPGSDTQEAATQYACGGRSAAERPTNDSIDGLRESASTAHTIAHTIGAQHESGSCNSIMCALVRPDVPFSSQSQSEIESFLSANHCLQTISSIGSAPVAPVIISSANSTQAEFDTPLGGGAILYREVFSSSSPDASCVGSPAISLRARGTRGQVPNQLSDIPGVRYYLSMRNVGPGGVSDCSNIVSRITPLNATVIFNDGATPIPTALSRVAIDFGSNSTYETDTSGALTIPNLERGTITLTPRALGYRFSPTSITITLNDATVFGRTYSDPIHFTVTHAPLLGHTLNLQTQQPIANAVIDAGNLGQVRSEASGDFTIPLVPIGATLALRMLSAPVDFDNPISTSTMRLGGTDTVYLDPLYTLSGTVTAAGIPLPGISVAGGLLGNRTTDANGSYRFAGLRNGSNYTLLVSASGMNFSQAARAGTISGSTVQDFAATSIPVDVRVARNGQPLSGITIYVANNFAATTTSADGIAHLANVSLTQVAITPDSRNYTFSPASYVGTVTPGQRIEFTATAATGLTGTVTNSGRPLANVRIDGGTLGITTTNNAGRFFYPGATPGSPYSLSATLSGYRFSPSTAQGIVSSNEVNFTTVAAPLRGLVTIRNTTTGITGVSIRAGSFGTTTTDESGAYSIPNIPFGTTLSVTPSRSGLTFAPAATTISAFSALTTANFMANVVTLTGRVAVGTQGLAGVSVNGGSLGVQLTDASGNYSFPNILPGTSYSVSPSLSGYTFSPSSRSGILSANATSDFVITHAPLHGMATAGSNTPPRGVPGVTITAAGYSTAQTATDGSFTIPNVRIGASLNVTATKAGLTFTPTPASLVMSLGSYVSFNTQSVTSFFVSFFSNGQAVRDINIHEATLGDHLATAGATQYIALPGELPGDLLTLTPTSTVFTFSPSTIHSSITEIPQAGFRFELATAPLPGLVTLDGIPLPDAVVQLQGSSLTRSTTTDSQGLFVFPDLPVGAAVTVSVSKPGVTFVRSVVSLTHHYLDSLEFSGAVETISSAASTSSSGSSSSSVALTSSGNSLSSEAVTSSDAVSSNQAVSSSLAVFSSLAVSSRATSSSSENQASSIASSTGNSASSISASAQSASSSSTPGLNPTACVGTNGFLNQVNIATVQNVSPQTLNATVRYFDLSGALRGQATTQIPAHLKFDFIINDLGLAADTYGTVCVATDATSTGAWSGTMTIYKPDMRSGVQNPFGTAFDYALNYPFTNPISVDQTVPLNTFHLGTKSNNVVANYIAISDARHDGQPLRGELTYYDATGSVIAVDGVTIPDGGRFDFPAHDRLTSNSNRDAVGFAIFRPFVQPDQQLPAYLLTLTRYFSDCEVGSCEHFLTAFAVPAAADSTGQLGAAVSTNKGLISVVELNNLHSNSAAVSFAAFADTGSTLGGLQLDLPPFGTQHVIMNRSGAQGFLSDDSVGSVRALSSATSITARAFFYKLSSTGTLEYAYATPFGAGAIGDQTTQFNSFIEHQNEIELVNLDSTAVTLNINAADFLGQSLFSRSIELGPQATSRFLLQLPANTYGSIVTGANGGNKFQSRSYVSRPGSYVLPYFN